MRKGSRTVRPAVGADSRAPTCRGGQGACGSCRGAWGAWGGSHGRRSGVLACGALCLLCECWSMRSVRHALRMPWRAWMPLARCSVGATRSLVSACLGRPQILRPCSGDRGGGRSRLRHGGHGGGSRQAVRAGRRRAATRAERRDDGRGVGASGGLPRLRAPGARRGGHSDSADERVFVRMAGPTLAVGDWPAPVAALGSRRVRGRARRSPGPRAMGLRPSWPLGASPPAVGATTLELERRPWLAYGISYSG